MTPSSTPYPGSQLDEFSRRDEKCRGTLSTGANCRTWWANELHPTQKGFEEVTKKSAAIV